MGLRGGVEGAYINLIFVVVVVWWGRWVTGTEGEAYIKLIFVVGAAVVGRWGHKRGARCIST